MILRLIEAYFFENKKSVEQISENIKKFNNQN